MLKFISFGSGSSGNCYWLATETDALIIDIGVGLRGLRKNCKEYGVSLQKVHHVLVTHDHADHIKSVGVFGENLFLPIYATAKAHEGINRSYCMTQKLGASVRKMEKYQPLKFRDFTIESFEVPHDGTDNVGYCIEVDGKTFCFITDLGEITETVEKYILKANYLVIESNYDAEMLKMGPHPPYLKERIASRTGHMCNADTAEFLATHWTPQLHNIWLCHLSKDNNHPDLAYKTVELRLKDAGIVVGRDVQLEALKRSAPSDLYTFE